MAHFTVGFGSFRLDLDNQCLWRGRHRLTLRPNAYAVLQLLVAHAGQLVTRDALFHAIWPNTVVSDDALRFCVRELRKTLHDTPHAPQFIETVHRRGYRFIASVHHDTVGDIDSPSLLSTQGPFRLTATGQSRIRKDSQGGMHQETITHLTEGLAVLDLLSESPARAQQELTLRLALGAPLIAAKGHASPEVEQTYAPARELCRLLGETPQLFPVLWGLAVNAPVRGELRLAREVSEHLLQRAHTLQDTTLQLEAHLLSGAHWRSGLEKLGRAVYNLRED